MRPAWSSFLALVAAAAALDAHIAAAGTTESRHAIAFSAQEFLPRASALEEIADSAARLWAPVGQWIGESYARAPALMLGLSVIMVVPPLALVGLIARRKRRQPWAKSPDTTLALTRAGKRSASMLDAGTIKTEGFSWPTEAWVDIQGSPGGRCVIGSTLVRIGREADNDIRLAAKTVHRYHAVIRRTTDGDVMITDLSGNDGNGVLVNGKPVGEARLKKGDVINVGEVKLHFDARPV
jgi:hypothetical protein